MDIDNNHLARISLIPECIENGRTEGSGPLRTEAQTPCALYVRNWQEDPLGGHGPRPVSSIERYATDVKG